MQKFIQTCNSTLRQQDLVRQFYEISLSHYLQISHILQQQQRKLQSQNFKVSYELITLVYHFLITIIFHSKHWLKNYNYIHFMQLLTQCNYNTSRLTVGLQLVPVFIQSPSQEKNNWNPQESYGIFCKVEFNQSSCWRQICL